MKKKSGFTIPELLAVIAILGVLITLSASVYNGVSNRVKKSTLNQKVNYFKEKALEYAQENDVGNKTISLSQLIELGYVDAEHPENPVREKIDNPVNNDFLDCMSFNITKELTDYQVEYDLNGSCELLTSEEKEKDVSVEKYVKVGDNFTALDEEWTNKDVYLLVKVKNMNKYTLGSNKIKFNVGGEVTSSNSSTYCDDISKVNDNADNCVNVKKVSTNYVFNNKVYVNLELTEKSLEPNVEAKTYKINKEVDVKIDNQVPTVRAEYSPSYTKEPVKISLDGNDGVGSGIYGYYFSKEDLPSDATKYSFASSTDQTVSFNGTYYLYTVDNAGNISKVETVNINNIDNEGPTKGFISGGRTSWTSSDVTIKFGCSEDNKVGCGQKIDYTIYDVSNGRNNLLARSSVNSSSTSYTFHVDDLVVAARGDDDAGTKKEEWKEENRKAKENYISQAKVVFTIYDNVGNSRTLEQNVSVMIDKVPPIITLHPGEKLRRSKWWGLITTGYGYRMNFSIDNKNQIPSGIASNYNGYSTSQTNLEDLRKSSIYTYNDNFHEIGGQSSDGEDVTIEVAKNSYKVFAFRAVSGSGTATYGTSIASERSCKEILGTAAVGGLVGLGVGGFALMLFGGPVGLVLGGAALIGAGAGAALCAAS